MRDTFNDSSLSEAVKMAHVRFGVIAPVIQGLFSEPTKTEYYKRAAEKPLEMPDGSKKKFNYNTFERWESKYRQEGIDGLMPKTRSDAGVSRVLSDAAIEEIYRLKDKLPRMNGTLIYNRLIADDFINRSDVSVSAVQRFIKRNNLKSVGELNVKDRKAFEEEFPGNMYQADTCHSVYIEENGKKRKTYLIQIVDDHSRLIVGSGFFYNDNAYNFQKVLKEAVARYGICSKLYADHGGPYENSQLTLILDSLGIVEIHAPIRDGAAKAKVERSFRTIKDTWLNGLDTSSIESLEHLNRLLADYVRRRNTTVNRELGETPMERYTRHMDRIRLPESQEWLDECFMNRVKRKVKLDSTISIDNVSYDVPMQFVRMKVEIRFLPDNMEGAYILYEGNRYPIRRTNKVENSRTKRKNVPSIDYESAVSSDNGDADV